MVANMQFLEVRCFDASYFARIESIDAQILRIVATSHMKGKAIVNCSFDGLPTALIECEFELIKSTSNFKCIIRSFIFTQGKQQWRWTIHAKRIPICFCLYPSTQNSNNGHNLNALPNQCKNFQNQTNNEYNDLRWPLQITLVVHYYFVIWLAWRRNGLSIFYQSLKTASTQYN